MNKNDFVNRLFNNGNGLTLDQIEIMERDCNTGTNATPAELRAAAIDLISRSENLLDLRDTLRNICGLHDITDQQVFALSYAICDHIH